MKTCALQCGRAATGGVPLCLLVVNPVQDSRCGQLLDYGSILFLSLVSDGDFYQLVGASVLQ